MNKQRKVIVNQKQQKLVHFLQNKTKKFQKIKNLLKILQQEDLQNLQKNIYTSIRILIL